MFIDFEGNWAKNTGKKSTDWLEDTFLIEKEFGKQIAVPHTKRHIGISFSHKRSSIFLIFFIIFFLLLIFRALQLQIFSGDLYFAAAEHNSRRILPIPSERGLIYDNKNIQLTKNIPNFSLALVPQDLPKDQDEKMRVVERLVELTGQDKNAIIATLEKYGNYSYESITIQEDLDYETALKIQIAGADIPGIHIQRGSKRLYLNDDIHSISHLLGYQGKLSPEDLEILYPEGYLPSDIIGKTGVEKTYEKILRGKYGKKIVEVDSRGTVQSVISQEEPIPGKNIRLSIDSEAQKELEKIMQNSMLNNGNERGAAIVMDPKSGEIIALVSLPSYDNNDFSGGISQETYQGYTQNENKPLFNRSISGTYPSGSTIKPAIAAAALQESIITPSTSFLSIGGLQVSSWFFPDWKAGGHGITNVRKSLAQSVNTFYYYIGGGYKDFVGLGVEKIVEYLKKFGFSRTLGIDLPSEAEGFLPSKQWKEEKKGERWYIGDTYNLSIGQGDILVTPLQIAAMTATIANGGTLYRPHVIQAIIDPITNEPQLFKPEVLEKQSIDLENLKQVRLGMRDCVNSGSCAQMADLPVAVAGKTGTAQWSSTKPNHAWFTSFAPFDKPQIVVTVLIEEGEEGSRVALPIAKNFYRWWIQHRYH